MDIDIKEQTENKKFEKVRYLTFEFGSHIVRLINTKVIYTHYFKSSNVTVKCLGEECPICKFDRQLMMENPQSFNKQKGWNPKLRRHYFNILDRTPVKICPQCGVENKKGINGLYTAACGECGTFISGVEETHSNKIKVANVSETNGVRLNAFQKSVLDDKGEPIGIENFDVMFLVTMTAERKKDITPVPLPGNNDKVEISSEQLYDLDKAVISVTSDEMLELQRGISLKDIFAARTPKTDSFLTEESDEVKTVTHTKEEINKKINEMFA